MTMPHNNYPRVSVVMSTYNGEEFVREQIDSILAQTYPVYEIIISDDCSTDSTSDILKEYSLRYENIKLHINDHNLGINENFKRGAMRAAGDFICFSDQDDIWFPDKVEKQMSAIGESVMCYSYHYRGFDMDHVRLVRYKCAPERQMFNAIVGHSMMLRSTFVREEDSWSDTAVYDRWISAYAHLKGGVVCVEEALNFHRSHEGQASASSKNPSYPSWYPYLFGFFKYRKLQGSPNFVRFYSHLMEKSEGVNELVNRICRLLLDRSFTSFFKLSTICMKNYKTVYPGYASGFMGYIRGFFYPCIMATYQTEN